jgi:uncharacterized membrane protein
MPLVAWLTTEREWPWRDDDFFGWPGLACAGAVLIALTLWTYSGHRRIGPRKLLVVLCLRLAALAVIAILLLRPAFASDEEVVTPGRLLILVDYSLSMKISDAANSSTRWDFVRRLLSWPEIKDALQRLQKEKQVEVVIYQAAEDVRKYDPESDADGKRTDIGTWLHALMQIHRNDKDLRGLVILSDGADNGTSYPLLDEAAVWRELPCPIHTFMIGSEATSSGQKDIAVVDVKTEPERVYIKHKVRIKATVDAPGMEGQRVTVHLLVDGKEISSTPGVPLPASRGNLIDVGEYIPDAVGEVKITVKIDEVPGEFTTLNNEMSTYLQVRKEGITILWVEGRKRLESTWILRRALVKDFRFAVTFDERTPAGTPPREQAEYFKTPEKSFDVVVIGDIGARRFSGEDPKFLDRIAEAVQARRTGLLMLGGYQTFGNGDAATGGADWPTFGRKIAELLPVDLTPGQIDDKGRMTPEPANRGHRLLQINDAGGDLWGDIFAPWDGHARLGRPRPGALVLGKYDGGEPVFVVSADAGPRAAAFAGDTTHKAWYRSDEAIRAYDRFWTQLMVWLARQEEGDNQLWIKLDKRRMAAGANQKLGFSIGLDGKDGKPARNTKYKVKVIGPRGEQIDVHTALKATEDRGSFSQANEVGEYKLTASATAIGPDGKEFSAGPVTARFMAFAEDVENQHPAANPQELTRLATAGGGLFHHADKEELLQYLTLLRERAAGPGWVKHDEWPNWRIAPLSDGLPDQLTALVQSLTLPAFVLFAGLLCTEWFLRRQWGLV